MIDSLNSKHDRELEYVAAVNQTISINKDKEIKVLNVFNSYFTVHVSIKSNDSALFFYSTAETYRYL